MGSGRRLLAGAATALAVLACADAALGATQTANYTLDGTLASSVGTAPPLTNVGPGVNAFETDGTRSVLAFPADNGLEAGVTGQGLGVDYSIVMEARLADVSGFRRLIDTDDPLDSDYGIYNFNGNVVIYDYVQDTDLVFSADTYFALAVVAHDGAVPAEDSTAVYVNGVLQAQSNSFDPPDTVVRFFKDDAGEESAGKVDCIGLFSGLLTATEVAQLSEDDACALPPPVPPADTSPPDTTIVKKPAAKTKSKKAKFSFSASESGSSFTCKLDKEAAKSCASPVTFKVKRGKHKLTVFATDAAGNADASPATYSWKVKKKKKKKKK